MSGMYYLPGFGDPSQAQLIVGGGKGSPGDGSGKGSGRGAGAADAAAAAAAAAAATMAETAMPPAPGGVGDVRPDISEDFLLGFDGAEDAMAALLPLDEDTFQQLWLQEQEVPPMLDGPQPPVPRQQQQGDERGGGALSASAGTATAAATAAASALSGGFQRNGRKMARGVAGVPAARHGTEEEEEEEEGADEQEGDVEQKLDRRRGGHVAAAKAPATTARGKAAQAAAEKERKRRMNREHCKRSRMRKRMLVESLQDQEMELLRANVKLRALVQKTLPDAAGDILERCTTHSHALLHCRAERVHASKLVEQEHKEGSAASALAAAGGDTNPPQGAQLEQFDALSDADLALTSALFTGGKNFCIADLEGRIIFPSPGFCALTGYDPSELAGRNCNLLQGPDTNQTSISMIREAIHARREIAICILNYKKNGTPFWNELFVAPLADATGNVVNFVGVQCEISELSAQAHKQRARKIHLQLPSTSS